MVAPGRRGRAIYDARRRRMLAAGQLALVDEVAEAGEWTPDDWATPPDFVRHLEEEFGPFDLDPCARPETAKAPRYFTRAEDGLRQPWAPARVFCNPPYSSIEDWLRKAREEAEGGALVVCLLPARPDRDWFHDHVLPYAEVRFLRGRTRFIGPDGTSIGRPWFASMLTIYRPLATVPAAPTCTDCGLTEAESPGFVRYLSGSTCLACRTATLTAEAR